MTTMLVIDITTRDLAVYTANVSRAEAGLVVRKAMEIAPLRLLAGRDRDWQNPVSTGLPVLVIGDGYQAQSSAGFTALEGGNFLTWYNRQAVVGMADYDRPLRLIRPTVARLYKPCRIVRVATHGNSNWGSAEAVSAGVDLLVQVTPSVIITEGQSDFVSAWRLLGEQPGSALEAIGQLEAEELDPEFRAERFTTKAVLVAAGLTRARRDDVIRPFDWALTRMEEVNKLLRSTGAEGLDEAARKAALEEALQPKEASPEPAASASGEASLETEPSELEDWEHELLAQATDTVAESES